MQFQGQGKNMWRKIIIVVNRWRQHWQCVCWEIYWKQLKIFTSSLSCTLLLGFCSPNPEMIPISWNVRKLRWNKWSFFSIQKLFPWKLTRITVHTYQSVNQPYCTPPKHTHPLPSTRPPLVLTLTLMVHCKRCSLKAAISRDIAKFHCSEGEAFRNIYFMRLD